MNLEAFLNKWNESYIHLLMSCFIRVCLYMFSFYLHVYSCIPNTCMWTCTINLFMVQLMSPIIYHCYTACWWSRCANTTCMKCWSCATIIIIQCVQVPISPYWVNCISIHNSKCHITKWRGQNFNLDGMCSSSYLHVRYLDHYEYI